MCLAGNQQLFTDKAAFRAIVQMIDDRLVRFGYSAFKRVDFQRPNWICCPFWSTFTLARLVEITKITLEGSFFFVHTNRP